MNKLFSPIIFIVFCLFSKLTFAYTDVVYGDWYQADGKWYLPVTLQTVAMPTMYSDYTCSTDMGRVCKYRLSIVSAQYGMQQYDFDSVSLKSRSKSYTSQEIVDDINTLLPKSGMLWGSSVVPPEGYCIGLYVRDFSMNHALGRDIAGTCNGSMPSPPPPPNPNFCSLQEDVFLDHGIVPYKDLSGDVAIKSVGLECSAPSTVKISINNEGLIKLEPTGSLTSQIYIEDSPGSTMLDINSEEIQQVNFKSVLNSTGVTPLDGVFKSSSVIKLEIQ
ncbi:hypothetical protein FKD80_20965 [Salmonella enterica]|nr:hypothetical protein [Salmonella enterica]